MFSPFIYVINELGRESNFNYKSVEEIIPLSENSTIIRLSSGKEIYTLMSFRDIIAEIESRRQEEIISVMKIELKIFNTGK